MDHLAGRLPEGRAFALAFAEMRPIGKRTKIVAAVCLAVVAVGCGLLWAVWPTPRVDMARYAPERTLAYVDVPSLPALATGLTETDAWSRLAGPLGLSSQLDYAGPVAEWLGRLDLGPNEAVALGRAQVALAITGLEAETLPEGEESALVVRPRFALIFKTHTRAATARALADERLPMLARRAYGEQAAIETSEYAGALFAVARHPAEPRQIIWAVLDDVVVVGNHEESVRAVVDTAGERAPSLANDFFLARLREEVRADSAAVFAFFPQGGVGRLAGFGPGLLAGSLARDADSSASVARIFGGVSEGAVRALAYSGSFEGGRFVDRYYTVFTPAMSDAVHRAVAPLSAEPRVLSLVPEGTREVTLVRIERPGDAFEAMLTALSSRVDVGISAALTQIAIEVRRSYGVVPEQPVSPMLGDEIAFVEPSEGAPLVAIFEARDTGALSSVVERYLGEGGARVATETHAGVDVRVSTNEDGRAAAFVGRYLVLGTRDQIARVAVAAASVSREALPVAAALSGSQRAILASQRTDTRDPAELLLAISGALRASDGSVELLERPEVRDALDGLPPAVSVTSLRDGGLYSETRSAVGNLTYLTALAGN